MMKPFSGRVCDPLGDLRGDPTVAGRHAGGITRPTALWLGLTRADPHRTREASSRQSVSPAVRRDGQIGIKCTEYPGGSGRDGRARVSS
jgi:hypothetical protein